MPRTSLAEILLASDTGTTAQLAQAGAVSRQRGVPLPEALVQQRCITDDTLLQAQSTQLGLPYWKALPEHEFDIALMTKVPLAFARRHSLVPIRMQDGAALVATSHPLDVHPLDDVSMLIQAPVEPVLSSEREILGVLNRLYETGGQTAAQVIEELDTQALGHLVQELQVDIRVSVVPTALASAWCCAYWINPRRCLPSKTSAFPRLYYRAITGSSGKPTASFWSRAPRAVARVPHCMPRSSASKPRS